MSRKVGGTPEKETICWECQNYSRCSWSVGIPVKGWKATPTKIVDNYGKYGERIIDSFLVEACPQFERDKKMRVAFNYVAKIIGKTERSAHMLKATKGMGALKDLVAEKGYKLYAYKVKQHYAYYLEKL